MLQNMKITDCSCFPCPNLSQNFLKLNPNRRKHHLGFSFCFLLNVTILIKKGSYWEAEEIASPHSKTVTFDSQWSCTCCRRKDLLCGYNLCHWEEHSSKWFICIAFHKPFFKAITTVFWNAFSMERRKSGAWMFIESAATMFWKQNKVYYRHSGISIILCTALQRDSLSASEY